MPFFGMEYAEDLTPPQEHVSLFKPQSLFVLVRNLDAEINDNGLHTVFSSFGKVLSCKVPLDGEGKSEEYGLVHFESEDF